MKNILIPDSIERIGAYAFSGCSSLKVIVIPPRVKILNGNTFEGCDSLKKLNLSNFNTENVMSMEEFFWDNVKNCEVICKDKNILKLIKKY